MNANVFEARHRGVEAQVRRRIERNGPGRPIRDAVYEQMQSASDMYLHANNASSRIQFSEVMAAAVGDFAAARAETPFFFVTLMRDDHVTPLDTASKFDIRRVIGWTYHVLGNTNLIGMVEGALVTTLKEVGHAFARGLSWHSHAIVWGVTEQELKGRLDDVNRRFAAPVPGLRSADMLDGPIDGKRLTGRARYMAKGMVAEYRVWPQLNEVIDDETGEVFLTPDRFNIRKRNIRPSDAYATMQSFVDRRIDALCFAAHGGKALRAQIVRAALTEFRRDEQRRAATRLHRSSVRHSFTRREFR